MEREGLSVRHPARFVLVGSGNPEEGELRPQLLDRFGLSVDVGSPTDLDERVEVIRRRDAYERGEQTFSKKWTAADGRLRRKIVAGRGMLGEVEAGEDALRDCARLCVALGSDGLRGELTLLRAARARAAFDGRRSVERADVRAVSAMALRHRLRRDPLDEAGSTARVARTVDEVLGAA